MRKFLVTRNVLVANDTLTPVNVVVHALSGADAIRFADDAKRDAEAAKGLVPARSNHERVAGDHLYTMPFAGLSATLFPNRKVKVRKSRNKVSK